MPPLVKKIMLPGLGCLLIAVLIDALLAWTGQPPMYLRLGHSLVPVNWTWLLSLPLCGAVGADLARYAGAPVKGRIAAAALPALAMAGLFATIAVVELPMKVLTGYMTGINTYGFDGLTGFVVWQVVVPGLMLVLGSLPFVTDGARLALSPSVDKTSVR